MIKQIEAILLSSGNAQKLADFYKDVVGLQITEEIEVGEKGEKGFEVSFGKGNGAGLYIMDHSEIKGKNSQGARVMFNLEVDDIEKEVAKVKENGVKLVQNIYHVEGYGLIATFEDVDGNYFQFVQVRPNES
ncbi:MAG TPA: VOC family protein [Patescibacteria group bacterium]